VPIYEYECPSCGEKFELRRGMNDDDSDVRCPRCGVGESRRVFSTFATTGSPGQACAPSSPG